ncbi:MAG: hypothetical protein Q9183_000850 [Haloplaca sp. 2 TL-2023]
MTERTFRDPSPKRGSSVAQHSDEPPPVPALPKGYVSPPPVPAKSLRRPASTEPPERVTSPVPRAGGRGVSLDRGPGTVPAKQVKKTKTPSLGTVGEVQRMQSRESINFSRPMSPQNSPPTSPLRDLKAWPGVAQTSPQPPTANMGALRAGEADNIQHGVQEAANRPVKKKKKAVAKEAVEGSHFATGGGAKPTGTAMETPNKAPALAVSTTSPAAPNDSTGHMTSAAQPTPKKKKKRVVSTDSSQGSYASDSDSAMSDQTSATDRPQAFKTRAAGLLAKQPSIVREDREAEEQEYGKPANLSTPNTTEQPIAPAAKKKATTKQHKKSASQPPILSTKIDSEPLDIPLPTSNAQSLTTQQPRPKSLSPGRATHFLAQPMYETPNGIKHQPPARSVSPAKSALKHSPSSRGASPVGGNAVGTGRLTGGPGSEASDNGSVVSDDGGKLRPKKKSARVSFDEGSVVMGRASTPPASSPTVLSPQHKDKPSKGFLGLGRRKKTVDSPDDSDQDEGMKPTPTLPSFGSVRGNKKDGNRPDHADGPQTSLPETRSSSDHAIGHVISHDLASKKDAASNSTPNQRAANDPIPPEVTTVEGSGYHSDNEGSVLNDAEDKDEPKALERSSSEAAQKGGDDSADRQGDSVPMIAILPATPGIGSTEDEGPWATIPGGYRGSTDDEGLANIVKENDEASPTTPVAEHHATDPTPASLGIAEPEPESRSTSPTGSPIVGHVAESIHHQTEVSNGEDSDDSGNSIYSDAAEDVADLEGDGFGSINAIMESPVVPKTPFVAGAMPESPTAQPLSLTSEDGRPEPIKRNESELSEPSPEDGWDRAQAYWSGLSQSRKDQLERAALPAAEDTSAPQSKAETVPEEKPKKKKKKVAKKTAPSDDPPLPPWPDKEFGQHVARPASPNAAKMKQSMRAAQPEKPQTHMRASMRSGPPPKSTKRESTLRPESPPVPREKPRKADRPMSAVAAVDAAKVNGKMAAGHGRAASMGVAPKSTAPLPTKPKKAAKPALRRAASDGSDSGSSFKKARPSTSDGGKYTMKRTMRGGSVEGRPQSAYATRQESVSTRPTSPPARRPFSSVGPGGSGMRTSMRESMDSNRTKSPSRGFGFGRKDKQKAAPAPKKAGSRFSSRFGDSSDEDEPLPKRQSRFEDSSDEEDREELTPVRGIPRKIEEGDSTDLEDSSASPSPMPPANDDKVEKAAPNPLQGSALASGSLRGGPSDQGPGLQTKKSAEKEKKKRSFFGSIGGGKKRESKSPPPNISLPVASTSTTHPLEANYASPVATPGSPQTPKASKVMGNKDPVATSSPLSSQAAAAASPGSPKTAKPPKLQRRNTPKRFASDSWPLPEMPAAKGESAKMRPSTSDGAASKPLAMGTMRPEANRSNTAERGQGAKGSVPNGLMSGGNGGKDGKEKKKRFPMLRKALGFGNG